MISIDAIKEREKIFSVCVKLLKVQTLRHNVVIYSLSVTLQVSVTMPLCCHIALYGC